MADEPDVRALVPIDKEEGINVFASEALDPTAGGGQIWSSMVPQNDRERILLHSAFQGNVPKLATVPGTTLAVTNVGRQLVTLVNQQTGEVTQNVRTLLFTDDGKVYSAVSDGIGRSLGMIFRLWKQPPWNPPLPLIMRVLDRPGAKRFHYLEVDAARIKKSGMIG